jgi:hypothetical protein
VAVNGGISFGVAQIKCISIAVWIHSDSTDITGCYGIDFKATTALSLDVYAAVEVVSAQFRESSTKY